MSESCDPMDYSLPGSSVCEILQARKLERVAMLFSKGSSRPRDWSRDSYISCIGKRGFVVVVVVVIVLPLESPRNLIWCLPIGRSSCLPSSIQILTFPEKLSQCLLTFFFVEMRKNQCKWAMYCREDVILMVTEQNHSNMWAGCQQIVGKGEKVDEGEDWETWP